MNSDDLIWSIISDKHCSYHVRTRGAGRFCRNEFNVTGHCNRHSCPLANSQYATVREDKDGKIYLYVRHAERIAYPKKHWEKVRLSDNAERAQAQIEENLIYWDSWLVRKIQLRLARLRETQKNARRLEMSKSTKRLVAVSRKQEKRETRREQKAQTAAQLDNQIEKELLERIKSGVTEDILNIDKRVFERVLDAEQATSEEEEEDEDGEENAEWEYTSASDLEESEEEIEDLEAETESEDEALTVQHGPLKRKATASSSAPTSGNNGGPAKMRPSNRITIQEEDDDDDES